MNNSTQDNVRNVAAILKVLFLKISTKRYIEKKPGAFFIILNLYKSGTFSSQQ